MDQKWPISFVLQLNANEHALMSSIAFLFYVLNYALTVVLVVVCCFVKTASPYFDRLRRADFHFLSSGLSQAFSQSLESWVSKNPGALPDVSTPTTPTNCPLFEILLPEEIKRYLDVAQAVTPLMDW